VAAAAAVGGIRYVGTSTARYPSGGDFDILVDDDADNTGYIIYTATQSGHVMSVEMLTSDYLRTVADAPPAPPPVVCVVAAVAVIVVVVVVTIDQLAAFFCLFCVCFVARLRV
jgi:hypothetical protein